MPAHGLLKAQPLERIAVVELVAASGVVAACVVRRGPGNASRTARDTVTEAAEITALIDELVAQEFARPPVAAE